MPKKTVKVSEVKVTPSEDTEAILDAIKELTQQIAELAKTVSAMKATHDKWVRAGKF